MERRWKVLAVVSIAVFMAGLDLFIVNIAFPAIGDDFDGASTAALTWVLNAYAIVFAALLVPAGRFADRVGRRRGFLAGGALFVAGSALCGAAPTLEVLIGARVVQAAGAALLLPTSLALLLPEFPPHLRPVAIAIWSAVGGLAAAFGPPLGGVLVEAGWRWVFLVNVPIGAAALVAAARLLRESRDRTQAVPDLVGTALLAGSVGLLALGLVQAPEWGWGAPATIASLAAAVAGTALFWVRCGRHAAPVVDLSMLRVRSFAMAGVASLAFNAAFAAMLLSSVLYLTQVWGASILGAGLALTPGPLTAALLAVPAGRLAVKLGPRNVAAAGGVLFAAGSLWWIWRAGPDAAYAATLLPGMLLTGAGVGLTFAPLASAATAELPPARFATGVGVYTMTRQIGAVLGVALLVAVVGAPIDWDAGWAFMAATALVAALAARAIGPVQHAAAPDAATSPAAGPATSAAAP
ncbi:MAG TPA: DHA2 family efflux MFS transporter permease subunit [Capillimicrobium sp.]|nr:DHA2 family efflux MFS transporter permease subunit [Capillimicrobium sp.]